MFEEIITLEFKRLDLIRQYIKIQTKYFQLTEEYQKKKQELYLELIKAHGRLGLMKQYKDNNQVLPVSMFDALATSQDNDIESKVMQFVSLFKDATKEFSKIEYNSHENIEAKEYLRQIFHKIYFHQEYNNMLQLALSSYIINDLDELKNIYFDIPQVYEYHPTEEVLKTVKERLSNEIKFLEKNYPEMEEEIIEDPLLMEQEKMRLQLETNQIQKMIDQAYDLLDDYESAGQA